LSRATASAGAERSVAISDQPGRSLATAAAMAPLPVPRSATRNGRRASRRSSAISTRSSVSGRGMRVSGVTLKFERPEALATTNIGDRLTGEPSREQGREAFGAGGIEYALGPGEQRGARPACRLGEQQLGLQSGARGRRARPFRQGFEREGVALIVGVGRDEQRLQFRLERVQTCACSLDLVASEHGHLGIGQQLLGSGQIALGVLVAPVAFHQRLKLGVLAAEIAKTPLIGLCLGFGQERHDLAEALGDALQLGANRRGHELDCCRSGAS
jgi:hypothetical protein